jgi:hypothetical protein
MRADLGVHTTLTRGDLQERRFEIAEATITVDNAMNEALEHKEQQKRGPWWCSLKLTQGTLVFGRPMTASGAMAMKLRDIRPVVTIINEFSDPPKWISLLPDVKNIDGSMIIDADGTATAVKDADITGESLQMLGSLRLAEKKADVDLRALGGVWLVSVSTTARAVTLSNPGGHEQGAGRISSLRFHGRLTNTRSVPPPTNNTRIERMARRGLPVATPTKPISAGPITAANLPSML